MFKVNKSICLYLVTLFLSFSNNISSHKCENDMNCEKWGYYNCIENEDAKCILKNRKCFCVNRLSSKNAVRCDTDSDCVGLCDASEQSVCLLKEKACSICHSVK